MSRPDRLGTDMPCFDAPVFAMLPRDRNEPVFNEPWEAQAFALAVRLSAGGCFTWTEWTLALGEQFREATARGEPDDGTHYFEHWLAALERLVARKGLATQADLMSRRDAWAAAYLATPHGQPVEMLAGEQGTRSRA